MKRYRNSPTEVGEQGQDSSDAFFERANLFSKHTGLPFVVWISYKGGAQHEIRVKVSPAPKALPSEMASVAIRPNVRVLEGEMDVGHVALLAKWIELNREALVEYWDGEIDTKDALDGIRPLK